jgi:Lon protease-like protein
LVDAVPPPDDGVATAERAVRRTFDLAVRLGYEAPDLDDVLVQDPAERLWQLAEMTPCGPLDKQRILAATSPEARADAVATAALDVAEMLALRLGPDA